MAAKLRANLPSDDLRVTIGDFETLDLQERVVDVVFSATVYHWISPKAQRDRPAAILKHRGIVAVVDLNQVASADDRGFFTAAQPIYERYGEGHTGPPLPTRDDVDPPIRQALEHDSRFVDITMRAYNWNQTYTSSAYRKLMLSYSGTQMMEPTDRSGLLDDMEALINTRFEGHITRPLVVTLTTAMLA